MESTEFEKLVGFATYHDLEFDKAEGTEADIKEATMLEEGESMDDDYKKLMLCILNKKSSAKPPKKQREKDNNAHRLDSDCYTDEAVNVNDHHYGLFLKSLRAHEKSYVIRDEANGVPSVVKYEGGGCSSSDEECDTVYKRKSRSAKKKLNNRPREKCKHDSQSTSSSKEAVNLSRRKLRKRASKSDKVVNVKISSDESVTEPDYSTFMKEYRVVEDHAVYEYGPCQVVYEPRDGEGNHEREDDDDWADDVKILDGTLFGKEGKSSPSTAVANDVHQNSEFRRQLMTVLRKPYDKEEYEKLWFDIEFRKPGERHIELRHGRERSTPTNKCGKSYLDYHPDLRRQLSPLHDDRPKCLNLLRGFFFWLTRKLRTVDRSNLGEMRNALL
ncbi:hypothetical protein OROHE_023618 [Orobanche hederae]